MILTAHIVMIPLAILVVFFPNLWSPLGLIYGMGGVTGNAMYDIGDCCQAFLKCQIAGWENNELLCIVFLLLFVISQRLCAIALFTISLSNEPASSISGPIDIMVTFHLPSSLVKILRKNSMDSRGISSAVYNLVY
jgi:hypothetical protein